MDRVAKEKLKTTVVEKLGRASAIMVAEYRGLTVEQLTKLRRDLRSVSAEFKVVKNRILKKAIVDDGGQFEPISAKLKGPLGSIYVYGDIAQATKKVLEFGKDNELFVLKGAVLEGALLSEDQMKAIADLPSKEVLLGNIIGSMLSPHRGLVTTLSGVSRQLVQVINAIKEKKSA